MIEKKNEDVSKTFEIVKGIENIVKVENDPIQKFIWKGIPVGSKGIITGVAKTGKTTFAENLAISLSIGRKEFFGEPIELNPQKVLYVNLEEGYKLFARRNLKQISMLTNEERELFCENYISTPEGFPEFLNSDNDWEVLREYIVTSKAEIVFIDSLSHMCVGEIEKSVVAQKFVQTFREYLGSLNKTFIIVHHNTKGNDRPISQDNIAGSRFILQEFEFAIGLANIPTSRGGNYMSMLYNKHIEKDDTTALVYEVNKNGWVDYLEKQNKFDLYKEEILKKTDRRANVTNKGLLYDYIVSLDSLGNTTITSKQLMEKFVTSNTMAKDTLYSNLNKLLKEEKVSNLKKGVYTLVNEADKSDDARK